MREVHLPIGSRQTPLPQRLFGRDIFWWLSRLGVLHKTLESRLGRRMSERLTADRLEPAASSAAHGVKLKPRALGASGRTISFADGSTLDVDAVIWATGYRSDHSWIEPPGPDEHGRLRHRRGVTDVPGLYFLGLTWQHTRGSALLRLDSRTTPSFSPTKLLLTRGDVTPIGRPKPRPLLVRTRSLTLQSTHANSHLPRIISRLEPPGLPEAPIAPELSSSATATSSTCASRRSPSASATRPCGCSPTTARSPARRCACSRARSSSSTSQRGRPRGDRALARAAARQPLRRHARDAGADPGRRRASPTGSSSPTPGVYWYHPHIREDYGQEMGLYGNIVVVPADPDYWPPAHREIVAHARRHPDRGRRGSRRSAAPRRPTWRWAASATSCSSTARPDLSLDAQPGEVVRFYLTNTANTRVFNVAFPGRADEARRRRQRPRRARGVRRRRSSSRRPSARSSTCCSTQPGELDARAPHAGADVPAGGDRR